MSRTAVLNIVGLTSNLVGENTPAISAFAKKNLCRDIRPAFPAVTCTAQANYITGKRPSEHGIVGNGWYNYDLAEVQFWKQPERLIQAPKLWESLKVDDPGFTSAKTFWWYNMYSSAEYSVTPRPSYPADGRKVFDIYSWPYEIRPKLKEALGDFPFPTFWGPAAGLQSPQGSPDAVSRWIADSAKWMEQEFSPTLQLVYLPHLDYNLQRYGPRNSEVHRDLKLIDAIVGDLIKFFETRGVEVILLSEYGIVPVTQPIHLNRLFRDHGWLTVKEELGLELIDFGASPVFSVADHQVAHIYLNNKSLKSKVVDLLKKIPEIDCIYSGEHELEAVGLNHTRAGDIVVEAKTDCWFTYYYWEDDSKAPDFARCVDIHRKPGYDPCELFIDPAIKFPKLKVASKLLKKKLGLRMLMDLIPLDARLVKGSHGKSYSPKGEDPIIMFSPSSDELETDEITSVDVHHIIRSSVLRKGEANGS